MEERKCSLYGILIFKKNSLRLLDIRVSCCVIDGIIIINFVFVSFLDKTLKSVTNNGMLVLDHSW